MGRLRFIKGALEYFEPIYSQLHEELIGRDLIHADEVPCQVLHEDGRKATQKSYMCYVTCNIICGFIRAEVTVNRR